MEKAITIQNPWAYLIANGIKDIENRSWKTEHRGKLLIHAAKKEDPRLRKRDELYLNRWDILSKDVQQIIDARDFVYSAIIGEVEVVDCIQNSKSIWATEGQWHWVLKNPKLYDNPILNVRGQLKIWNYK